MSKRLLSASIAISMIASMSLTSFASATVTPGSAFASSNLDFTTEVESPIIEYVVPTSGNVILNPYQIGDETDPNSQIFSAPIEVINKSNVPIYVSVNAKVTLGENVELKATAEEAKATGVADEAKKAHVQLIPATALAEDTSAAGQLDSASTTFGDYLTDGTEFLVLSTEDANITYALDAAEYEDADGDVDTPETFKALANDADPTNPKVTGAGAFRVAGTLNSYAAWAAADITVNTVYKVNGLPASEYTTMMADSKLTSAVNVASMGAANTTPAESAPSIAESSFAAPASGNLEIPVSLGSGDLAATKVKAVKYGTSAATQTTALAANTGWTYDADNGKLIIKAGTNGITKVKGGKYVAVIFDDAAETTVVIQIN